MAREYASIRVVVWQDDDFRALPKDAQLLYFTLLTMPALSYCGVLDWRPKRVTPFASDWSYDDIMKAAGALEEHHYLVTDEQTEEALIRSFIRNDGLMKEPRMAVSMARAYGAVGSRKLQGVIVHELRRLYAECPDLKGWHKEEARRLLDFIAINPRDVGPNAPLFGPNADALLPAPTPSPHSDLPTPVSTDSAQPKPSRPTRIPDPFDITTDMRRWSSENTPGLDIDWYTQSFIDFWRGKSGANATKLDWVATWRNWMRSEHGKPHARRMNGHGPPSRHDENAAVVERMRQEEVSDFNPFQQIEAR